MPYDEVIIHGIYGTHPRREMRVAVLAIAVASAAEATRDNNPSEQCETTLRYFDVRGRGEAIRMAMHNHSIPFTDASFSSDEWGKFSPDGLKAKLTSEGKLPFGQVLEMSSQDTHHFLRTCHP